MKRIVVAIVEVLFTVLGWIGTGVSLFLEETGIIL